MAIRVLQGSRISFAPRPEDIPELRTQVPEQRFIPTSSASASALQTLGTSVINAGRAFGQAGALDQQRDEARQADAIELNFKNKLLDLQFGSADGTITGWMSQRGQAFFDGRADRDEAVKQARADAFAQAGGNVGVAQVAGPRLDRLVVSNQVTMLSRGADMRRQAEVATDKARVVTAQRSAIAMGINVDLLTAKTGSLNPIEEAKVVAFTGELALVRAAVIDEAAKQDITVSTPGGQDYILNKIEDAWTEVHRQHINNLLADGKGEEAARYYNWALPMISSDLQDDIENDIKTGVSGETARNAVTLSTGANTPEDRRKLLDDNLVAVHASPEAEKEARINLRAYEVQLLTEQKARDAAFTDMWLKNMKSGENNPAEQGLLHQAEAHRLKLYEPAMKQFLARQTGKTVPFNKATVKQYSLLQRQNRLHTVDIYDPKIIKALGPAWPDFRTAWVRELAARTGSTKELAKLSRADIKKSQDLEAILKFGEDKFKQLNYNDEELWIARVAIGRMLDRFDKTTLLDNDAKASIITDAVDEVEHDGLSWFYSPNMSNAEAQTLRETEGHIHFIKPDEFDARTAERFGVPLYFVKAARETRLNLGVPVMGVLIRNDYRKAQRQAKKKAANAQLQKAPPPTAAPTAARPEVPTVTPTTARPGAPAVARPGAPTAESVAKFIFDEFGPGVTDPVVEFEVFDEFEEYPVDSQPTIRKAITAATSTQTDRIQKATADIKTKVRSAAFTPDKPLTAVTLAAMVKDRIAELKAEDERTAAAIIQRAPKKREAKALAEFKREEAKRAATKAATQAAIERADAGLIDRILTPEDKAVIEAFFGPEKIREQIAPITKLVTPAVVAKIAEAAQENDTVDIGIGNLGKKKAQVVAKQVLETLDKEVPKGDEITPAVVKQIAETAQENDTVDIGIGSLEPEEARVVTEQVLEALDEDLIRRRPPVDPTVVQPSPTEVPGPGEVAPAAAKQKVSSKKGVIMKEQEKKRVVITRKVINALAKIESGGDIKAESPVGALGKFQIMPKTAANPGFGVKPLSTGTDVLAAPVAEQERFMIDYLQALTERLGSLRLGLMAYNWGYGNVRKWLTGKTTIIPRETRNYIKKFQVAGILEIPIEDTELLG